jgi:hypothetical protein
LGERGSMKELVTRNRPNRERGLRGFAPADAAVTEVPTTGFVPQPSSQRASY